MKPQVGQRITAPFLSAPAEVKTFEEHKPETVAAAEHRAEVDAAVQAEGSQAAQASVKED